MYLKIKEDEYFGLPTTAWVLLDQHTLAHSIHNGLKTKMNKHPKIDEPCPA
jgi:hypothetical protein